MGEITFYWDSPIFPRIFIESHYFRMFHVLRPSRDNFHHMTSYYNLGSMEISFYDWTSTWILAMTSTLWRHPSMIEPSTRFLQWARLYGEILLWLNLHLDSCYDLNSTETSFYDWTFTWILAMTSTLWRHTSMIEPSLGFLLWFGSVGTFFYDWTFT